MFQQQLYDLEARALCSSAPCGILPCVLTLCLFWFIGASWPLRRAHRRPPRRQQHHARHEDRDRNREVDVVVPGRVKDVAAKDRRRDAGDYAKLVILNANSSFLMQNSLF